MKRGMSNPVLLLVLCFLAAAPLAGSVAGAATQAEILAQAGADLQAGKPLNEVVAAALAAGSASGIPPENLAAALAETLLQTGLDMKQEGVSLAGSLAQAFYAALNAQGADTAATMRSLSQMSLGIRAACARNGLSDPQVQAQIKSSLALVAGSEELATQFAAVIDSAYQGEYAETYTPPPAAVSLPGAPPDAPAPPGGDVSQSYDPQASRS